ncbi:KUP/HAK/KT family potassium transporter [Micromonospora sicca]|uniref:KUP/HAK/KT family potassium transporter n=1 Tax=Micromonospora sicca TaxID=2202420 RepID=UPI003F65C4A0
MALRANVAHNHVRHERIVIITGRTANVPHIPWDQRLTIDDLGDPNDGIIHITAVFGFQDPTDFPEVLRPRRRPPPRTNDRPRSRLLPRLEDHTAVHPSARYGHLA